MNEAFIRELFETWKQALASGNAAKVVTLYAEDAIFQPTLSKQLCHSHKETFDYYEFLLERKTNVVVNQSYMRIFDSIAIHSGIYTFFFDDTTEAQARFTFIYKAYDSGWKIIEHHSSRMPESA